MPFPSRKIHPSIWSTLAPAIALVGLPLLTTGCTEVACFEWSEGEGVCPTQDEAPVFFEEPFCKTSDIKSVDSDGEYDEGACCYVVTKHDDDYYGGCEASPSSGISVSAVTVTGAGGFGGAGGMLQGSSTATGTGGIGSAGGSMGCVRCGEVISGGDPALLCDDSVPFYESFSQCMCEGACSMVCAASCDEMMSMSTECEDCIGDTVSGCGNELSVCANDI